MILHCEFVVKALLWLSVGYVLHLLVCLLNCCNVAKARDVGQHVPHETK